MSMFATVYVLCYGNYITIHRRVLNSLVRYLPHDEARVVVWGNELGSVSRGYIEAALRSFKSSWFYAYDGNMPKYKVMRKLWHEDQETAPQTPWILWLDDDTYISQPDWWKKTQDFLGERADTQYAGQLWYVHHLPGQWDFIKESSWFKGVPPEMLPTRAGPPKPGIRFATGSYLWLRTDTMRLLNWPDQRLNHNGGDTLLGEAVRQHGVPRRHCAYGVLVNKAKRRGFSEKPAGSSIDTRR